MMNFCVDTYLNELRPLVNVDCGTFTVEGIEVVASVMAEKYNDLGWSVKRLDMGKAGCGIEARNKPEAEHIDVMLVGHMDTVFPEGTVAERPLSSDGVRAYGPGVSDMKSGLLNIVYALRGMDAEVLNKLSIAVCMNPDEEVGSGDSAQWLAETAKKAGVVLVAESARADGSLVKARKGMACYELQFKGVAAHAGNEPEKGRSAISEMAHWITAINEMTSFESGTTFNVGVVSGGAGSNVVAESASAIIDVRFWDNDEYAAADEKLRMMLENTFDADVSVTMDRKAYKPSMVPSEKTEELMVLVEEAGRNVNIDITWQAVGGGSDANLTAVLGVPSLDGLGPIGGGFHSDKEFLELNSIEPRINLLKEVLKKLAE